MGRWSKVAVAFLAGLLFVVALRVWYVHSPPANLMIVHTYEVPPEIAREVADVLSSAMGAPRGGQPIIASTGRAIVAPGGRIVVTATPEMQRGAAEVIASILSRPLPPTPSVRFDLWIVTGAPGDGPPKGNPIPDEIEPALESLRKSRGAMRFQLVDHLVTSARSGQDTGHVSGSRTTFDVSDVGVQKSPDGKERIVAKIGAGLFAPPGKPTPPAELHSQADLTPGELLVVGQSLAGLLREDDAPGQEIYYIVRATL